MDLSAIRIPPSGISVYPKNFTSEQCLTPLFVRLTFSFNFFSIKSNAFHYSLPCLFAFDIDVTIIRIATKTVASTFQFLIQFV